MLAKVPFPLAQKISFLATSSPPYRDNSIFPIDWCCVFLSCTWWNNIIDTHLHLFLLLNFHCEIHLFCVSIFSFILKKGVFWKKNLTLCIYYYILNFSSADEHVRGFQVSLWWLKLTFPFLYVSLCGNTLLSDHWKGHSCGVYKIFKKRRIQLSKYTSLVLL